MSDYWFKPKLRGIGPGIPTNWKGWALFGGCVLSILSVPSALTLILGYEGSVLLRMICVLAVSVPFLLVAWKKTEGGWRWRRGEDEPDEMAR